MNTFENKLAKIAMFISEFSNALHKSNFKKDDDLVSLYLFCFKKNPG